MKPATRCRGRRGCAVSIRYLPQWLQQKMASNFLMRPGASRDHIQFRSKQEDTPGRFCPCANKMAAQRLPDVGRVPLTPGQYSATIGPIYVRSLQVDTGRAYSVVWMLGQRLRRWPNIETTLDERLALTGPIYPALPSRHWSMPPPTDVPHSNQSSSLHNQVESYKAVCTTTCKLCLLRGGSTATVSTH